MSSIVSPSATALAESNHRPSRSSNTREATVAAADHCDLPLDVGIPSNISTDSSRSESIASLQESHLSMMKKCLRMLRVLEDYLLDVKCLLCSEVVMRSSLLDKIGNLSRVKVTQHSDPASRSLTDDYLTCLWRWSYLEITMGNTLREWLHRVSFILTNFTDDCIEIVNRPCLLVDIKVKVINYLSARLQAFKVSALKREEGETAAANLLIAVGIYRMVQKVFHDRSRSDKMLEIQMTKRLPLVEIELYSECEQLFEVCVVLEEKMSSLDKMLNRDFGAMNMTAFQQSQESDRLITEQALQSEIMLEFMNVVRQSQLIQSFSKQEESVHNIFVENISVVNGFPTVIKQYIEELKGFTDNRHVHEVVSHLELAVSSGDDSQTGGVEVLAKTALEDMEEEARQLIILISSHRAH